MLVEADFNALTHDIIGAAIEIHRALGPGMFESVYVACLEYELATRQIRFVRQKTVPLIYKDIRLDAAYRVDLIVDATVVVAVKCVEHLLPIHQAQALTYLGPTGCPVALLIN